MDVQKLGPLHVRKVVKTTGTAGKKPDPGPLTVVLMHGFGAPGDDLVAMAGAIDAPLGTTFVFPEAPLVLADPMFFGNARAWWLVDIGRYERAIRQGTIEDLIKDAPEGMASARAAVTGMLEALAEENQGTKGRLVIGGFSQGSMIAADVALRTKVPLAGLVLLSGTLLDATVWLPAMPERKGLRVLQSHGSQDPILPFALAQLLHRSMSEAGLEVSFRSFEGGHGIPPTVLRDLGQWLHQLP
jgi:phospholipase/carboxylesterase